MMVHHLPQEPHIMVISLQELSKMLSVDMHHKQDIMFLEDSAGTAMDFQFNTKLINNLKSPIKGKFWKWVLPLTMLIAEALS